MTKKNVKFIKQEMEQWDHMKKELEGLLKRNNEAKISHN